MSEATASAATIAARRKCHIAHIVAIEGLAPMFCDDETGELLGSGAGTWIGESEDDLGATVGDRIMLPGLRLPAQLRESLDPKTGLLGTQNITIRLVDYDGTLADLFASEGKAFDLLAENIPAGTSALAASVAISGGSTTNPRGRHVGLERIGPNGERGYLSPFPFDLIGRHHAVNLYGNGEEGPRPIPISDDPLDFTRRKVAIYRLVRRNLPPLTGHTAWPLWQDQYRFAPGCLVWWGELTDRGTIAGNREWDLKASGAASWLQKTLNQHAPTWRPISSTHVSLADAQRYAAIEFRHVLVGGGNPVDLSVGFRQAFSAVGDGDTWRAELQTLMADVVDGSESDYGGTAVDQWEQSSAGILEDGTFWIRRQNNDAVGATQGAVQMLVTMHETIWRSLGFDPPLQDYGDVPLTEETQIRFRQMEEGDTPGDVAAVGNVVPAGGYWSAAFTTGGIGSDGTVSGYWYAGDDNGGHPRYWRPVNAGDPLILQGPQHVPQTLLLPIDQPYIEPSNTVQWATADNVARYFAIRGKRAVGVPVGPGQVADQSGHIVEYGDVEAEDYGVVVRCEWEPAGYGALVEVDGQPAIAIVDYEDGRKFGVPFEPIVGEWSQLNTADSIGLEIAPLMTYGYGSNGALGRAIECWYQLMLSTGAASGWVGPESGDPAYLFGPNSHTGQDVYWVGDTLVADHGLAIPSDLVTEPNDAIAEWDRVPGGNDGALSRIGLAYVGPQKSTDVLASIMQPRALAWSLAGGRYGVVLLAPFNPDEAEVSITEESLYAHPTKPSESIPRQELRAVGQLDRVKLSYRYNPLDGDRAMEREYRARDREAQARRGDLAIEIFDDGLVPQEWDVPGVPVWEHDFRDLWEANRSEFFARRHFLVTGLRLHRLAGSTVRVGTRVRLTNPWPVNPAGGYGLTDACGIVTDWQYLTRECCYVVSVLVFAGQFTGIDLFMPIGRVSSTSGANITIAAEDESAGLSGASRFNRPSWASGNQAAVRFVSFDRSSWSISSVYYVSSVAGNVVTLTGAPAASEVYRDRDLFLVMADVAEQTGRWPETYGAALVLDNLQHPGGQGSPLEP